MCRKILVCVLLPALLLSQNARSNEPEKRKIVVIDAGHGGKDTGAIGKNAKEKDLVLSIALLVGKYLEENLQNVDVIYTRDDDTFVPLRERAAIANKNNADLFVSIHINSNKSTRPYGTETFAIGSHKTAGNLEVAKKENAVIVFEEDYTANYEGFDPNSAESYIMFSMMQNVHVNQSLSVASYVEDEFKNRAMRYSRGVKQAGFLVLWLTSMPSVLVECGFISNEKEEVYLMSKQGQEYLASAIYRGVKKYLLELVEDEKELLRPNTVALEDDMTNTSKPVLPNEVVFRIQATASSQQIAQTHAIYKNYAEVYEYQEKGTYKYAIGRYNNYDEAKSMQETVQQAYPGAFIIAFKGSERISVSDAMKLQ